MSIQIGVLGKAIRDARIKHQFSQEEFSEMVGITPTHLKHLESEHRKPSIEVLFRIAETLNLSLDNILFPPENATRAKLKDINNLLTTCSLNELQIVEDLLCSLNRNLKK